MKLKFIFSALALIIMGSAFCQKPVLELTFSARHDSTYLQLDSIQIINRTQGSDTTLYWPDTVLIVEYQLGVPDLNPNHAILQVYQNYPNPMVDQTIIPVYVPDKDKVAISVIDNLGQVIFKFEGVLEAGNHSFRLIPGHGKLFFFTAAWRGNSSSIKIIKSGSVSNRTGSLEYIGFEQSSAQLKAMGRTIPKSFKIHQGDVLLSKGFRGDIFFGGIIYHVLQGPPATMVHLFQSATNIPCPGVPTVNYGGQVYNTIQIYSQCWLKENLNVGEMISSDYLMTNNGQIEKYCYKNKLDSCTKLGGLYQWDEMMQYSTNQVTQGICPTDWHIPTDEEWKVLEGEVDGQYGVGDPTWDLNGFRGFIAGANLLSKPIWYGNGEDAFGFSALTSGCWSLHLTGHFADIPDWGYLWTSTEHNSDNAIGRILTKYQSGVGRAGYDKKSGFSVRCIKNN